jgi:outer membrane protein TolC
MALFGSLICTYPPVNAAPLTLQDCVVAAIRNSPELSAQQHMVDAYRADITKKRSTTLPYLSSQLQSYELNGSPVTPWSGAGAFEPENGLGRRSVHWTPVGIESIGVSYPIINEGSLFGLNHPPVVSAARAQEHQGEIIQILAKQKLIFQVVSDFIYIASYREQAVTLGRIVDRLNLELQIVQTQVRLGRKLPHHAELIAEEQRAFDSARFASLENATNFVADLSLMIGTDATTPERAIEIDNKTPQLVRLPSLSRFLAQALSKHPALQAQNTNIEIARQQLRVDDANQWPTANLNLSFQGAQDLDYFNGNRTHIRPTAFQSYLTVNIPLFDFGGRRAAISESQENLMSQREQLKQVELDIRSSITRAYGDILEDVATTARLQSQLEADDEKLTIARAQMAQGDTDRLEVLRAETVTLQDALTIQLAAMSERLKYAELQNLSAGNWHWAP